ncbi:hypothetical protein NSK_005454 [Nannochloropsis salina CCMP1776]|uniref:Uncharacterized protein n=1 Tax=Nannochloropsis salina CCMP1776 TaxID=1027361 RepID=A0A4D9CYF8_9STRA|nr:hypothetical protein NSK_005454 [Nannochloropsis salina CCMP1776]|eukprot:TFJ83237.1 hypothetical protein NSK_005454 [Nannochloropsis salina CCMP1776]
MGSIFHCVLLGQVAQRLQYCLRYKEVVSLTLGLWMFSCFLYATLPRNAIFGGLSNLSYFLLSVFILYQLRGRARTQFSIPGDLRSDFFASLCCSFCTLTQLARHLFDRPHEPGEDEEEDLWIEDGHSIR